MNLISVSQFKKAQIILRINSFLLFLFIIATPYLIKEGAWGMSEAQVEALFLAVEIGVLIRLFKSSDFYSNKSDRKVNELSGQLKEQKELSIDTLKYLGKINVQMSIVKQLVKKFKTPAQKKRLDGMMEDMLQSIAGIIGNKKIGLRIVELDNYKTIYEMYLDNKNEVKGFIKNVSNKILCDHSQRKQIKNTKIILSEHDNFSLKTFLFIKQSSSGKEYKINVEQFDLIQDVVNQCEVMYLLCKSKYHRQK